MQIAHHDSRFNLASNPPPLPTSPIHLLSFLLSSISFVNKILKRWEGNLEQGKQHKMLSTIHREKEIYRVGSTCPGLSFHLDWPERPGLPCVFDSPYSSQYGALQACLSTYDRETN